ncbi:septum site-determining protein MinC [Sulfitobacter aestuarii]|uniref:Probable septum site-determining protein MinC n=1 Tax=Sulfitobacter aestuarii TaxID=2161676 RepID=A0ABW5U7K6_9RHOB
MPAQDATAPGQNNVAKVKPFQIRGRFFTAVALRLGEVLPDDSFYEALDEQLRLTPQFFADAPVIIDLEQAAGMMQGEDVTRLVKNLRQRKLSAFGVQNADSDQAAAAEALGLIPITIGHEAPLRGERSKRRQTEELAKKAQSPANRIVTTPVRSGQTVIADQGDLVIVGPVASGAELIAAGNIHVYGRLRGRALAGVNGDDTARIFCQSLDAELLAITGLYRTSDNLEPELLQRSVQVFLQDESLCVEALE